MRAQRSGASPKGTKQSTTFYIIDANSLFYRAFYAIPGLTNPKGEPTNAVYGFTNILFKILNERPIDYIACAFDSPGPTLRHKKFSQYKIHRKGMPEELVSQIPLLKEVLRAMRIPVFEKEGYEADDIMATLVKRGESEGCRIFVVTNDKDAMQLINDKVFMLQPGKNEKEIAGEQVKEILGVHPSQVPDLFGLMGDSSDGLPGIPGIGPKTASKLINEYGSLEGIYKNLDSIPKTSLREKLSQYRDSCRQTRELAVLEKDVPVDIDWDGCKNIGSDNAQLIKVFRELGFNRLIQRLLKKETKNVKLRPEAFKGIKEIKELIEGCKKKKELVIYFNKKKDTLLLALDQDNIFVLGKPFPVSKLKAIMSDGKIKKIGHGFKQMLKSLRMEGLDLGGLFFDLEVASYVLNPERPSHDLNGLSLDFFGEGLNEGHGELVQSIFALKRDMAIELKKAQQEELFYKIEMPLVEILAGMEMEGIRVNQNKLVRFSKRLAKEISIKEDRIFSEAREKFNLNSSQQIGRILFHKLGLPPQKRTKTGLSTNSEVLEILAPLYPIAREILDRRELYKMKSTFVDGLIELINSETGKLHTTFNQTVTSTGRLSSSNPNLQNIPIRSKWGKELRETFEAGKGKLLLSFDYSQIELRILAHLSNDTAMKEAFKRDEDIHTATARQIFNLKEKDEVTSEMRRQAKIINFGIIYGMSAYGLGKQLGIGPDEAQDYIDQYMTRFPSVKRYIEFLVKEARKNGFARTMLERRRPLVGKDIERLAINTPIQGTAADIIKMAMVEISEEFKKQKLKTVMLLQVHDELLFEVPENELGNTKKIVKSIMENVFPLSVPLKVNISWGKTWADIN